MTGKTKSKKIEKNRKKCVSSGVGSIFVVVFPKKIQKTGLDQCTTVIRACHSVVGSGHKYEYNQQIVVKICRTSAVAAVVLRGGQAIGAQGLVDEIRGGKPRKRLFEGIRALVHPRCPLVRWSSGVAVGALRVAWLDVVAGLVG